MNQLLRVVKFFVVDLRKYVHLFLHHHQKSENEPIEKFPFSEKTKKIIFTLELVPASFRRPVKTVI
jgi:hypothetical protein